MASSHLSLTSLPNIETNIKEARFSPYVNNGGTVVAIAGKDFVVVGADTRISSGYSIHTRTYLKLFRVTDKCVIATSGMVADMVALQKQIEAQLTWYYHQHGRYPSTPSIAQFLSNTLYYRRFFPYYTFNVLAGVDQNGEGCVYSYDAVGSFQRLHNSSSGTGHLLIQSLLDNQLGLEPNHRLVSRERAVELVKDGLTSIAERDIHTGDAAEIWVLDSNGITKLESFPLKLD